MQQSYFDFNSTIETNIPKIKREIELDDVGLSNEIVNVIDTLKAMSGTNDKISYVSQFEDNKSLIEMFKLLTDTRVSFGIAKIPHYENNGSNSMNISSVIKNDLPLFVERELTGYAAINHLKNILENLPIEQSKILEQVVTMKLGIGLSLQNLKKSFPNVDFFEAPYMGAKAYDRKKFGELFKKGFVFVQTKEDGRYANMILEKNKLKITSRAGNITYLGNDVPVINKLETLKNENIVFNGELVIYGIDRYTSNGMIASFCSIEEKRANGDIEYEKDIKKFKKNYAKDDNKNIKVQEVTLSELGQPIEKISDTEFYDFWKNKIEYVVWDVIDTKTFYKLEGEEPYLDRFEKLQKEYSEYIKIVDTIVTEDPKEAMKFFKDNLSKGLEGAIAKSALTTFKNGKGYDQLKLKLEFQFEMRIIGFNQGEKGTKNENTLGSLICVSEDRMLYANPAGISDELKDEIWNNREKFLDKIVTIKCNGVTPPKNDGVCSVLSPVLEIFRDDKTVADSVDEINKIQESILALDKDKE